MTSRLGARSALARPPPVTALTIHGSRLKPSLDPDRACAARAGPLPETIRQDIIDRSIACPCSSKRSRGRSRGRERRRGSRAARPLTPRRPGSRKPPRLPDVPPRPARAGRGRGPRSSSAIGRTSHAMLALSPALPSGSSTPRSTGFFSPGSCPRTARRAAQPVSSARSFRTRPRNPAARRRRALRARCGRPGKPFADLTESEPELLARHCAEAGLVKKPRANGGKRDCGRWRAPRSSRPRRSSRGRSPRSRRCRALRPCGGRRSNSRSASLRSLMHTRGLRGSGNQQRSNGRGGSWRTQKRGASRLRIR